jgi:hypothetical protein
MENSLGSQLTLKSTAHETARSKVDADELDNRKFGNVAGMKSDL